MPPSPNLARALGDLASGRPILVYDADGREEETDLLFTGHRATPDSIALLRRDAGGLVFLAVGHDLARATGLPFAQDVMRQAEARWPVLRRLAASDIPYDSRSSFSLWVNHRDTFTGITDRDRALTVSRVAHFALEATDAADGSLAEAFGAEFRSPGHVALCVADPQPLVGRKGHTELAVALSRLAGIPEAVVGCEMMDPRSHGALSKADAVKYARLHDLVFLEGSEVTEAFLRWLAQAEREPVAATV